MQRAQREHQLNTNSHLPGITFSSTDSVSASSVFEATCDLLCPSGVMLSSLSARGPVGATPKACR